MLRFGLVGAQGIARKFARDINFVPEAEIIAVAGRDKESSAQYKTSYQLQHAFDSYTAMAESNLIDAVYIATPHNFHQQLACQFLAAGKHVLVEKPMAVNQQQVHLMCQSAQQSQCLLMEAMWTRFLPAIQEIKQIVNQAHLGKLISAEVSFGYPLIDDYPIENRLLNPELAGGSLLDMGVYPLSFLRYLDNGPLKSIQARADFTHTGVDQECEIHLQYEQGLEATLRCSIARKLANDALLEFEHGHVRVVDFHHCQTYYINDELHQSLFLAEGFPHQIQAFVMAAQRGEIETAIMPHRDSLDVATIMDSVREQIGLKYPFEQALP